MTRHFSPPSQSMTVSADMLVAAARCWRGARDGGRAVQPDLFSLLARHDCGMLAPVLDSLMTLWEVSLGRDLSVGQPDKLSDDEHVLVALFDGTPQPWAACADCSDEKARIFACALCSTRIMMERVMPDARAEVILAVGRA